MDEQERQDVQDLLYGYTAMMVIGGKEAAKIPLEGLLSYIDTLLAKRQARQITPEMDQIWQAYQAEKGDRPSYHVSHDKMEQYKDVLWAVFVTMMGEG